MNQQYLMFAIVAIVVCYFFMGRSQSEGFEPAAYDMVAPDAADMTAVATNTDSMFCAPSPAMSSEDLLPSADFMEWAKLHPSGAEELNNRNFLTAGHHIGINTVGQSLRNANLQVRSEPPNPQSVVSPWLQSTIGPDLNRKPLEINENNPVEYYDL